MNKKRKSGDLMSLGEKLIALRKKEGLSQEDVAEKLNVSRQTVSKWETDQTVPDLFKVKLLCQLYSISYDQLISESKPDFDVTNMEAIVDEIDWTRAWSTKYPILASYQNTKGIEKYCDSISDLYDTFKKEFHFSDTDTVLVLKDILYQKYKKANTKIK